MSIEVDAGGVRGAGEAACVLAQRLRAARSAWDSATRDGQSACGLPVARAAFRSLQDAWFTEVGAHATVLEQLCAALGESADTYQLTDEAAAVSLKATSFLKATSLRVADSGQ
ncbi:MAG: type VII secretion target [Pseudonocardiaceae bacterium]